MVNHVCIRICMYIYRERDRYVSCIIMHLYARVNTLHIIYVCMLYMYIYGYTCIYAYMNDTYKETDGYVSSIQMNLRD